MNLLGKLFGKERTAGGREVEIPPCPHTAMVPRWDSAEDMGKLDRATSYFCTACETTFSPEEAKPYLGV